MEILIPGLILVALMIWASTKIKNNAARAFQPETVTNDRFSIVKPDGFLSPVDPGRGLLFAAYSRDFGTDEAEGIRHAAAEISEHPGANFAEVRQIVAETSDITAEEPLQMLGDTRCQNLNASRTENGVELKEYVKLIETGDSILHLTVTVMAELEDEYSARVREMLDSFRANQAAGR